MEFEKILQLLGVSLNESKVYQLTLKIGPSQAGSIVREGNLSRSSVYKALEGLIAKGFMSATIKNGKKTYYPEDPRMIGGLLQSTTREFEQAKNAYVKILPTLYENKVESYPDVSYYDSLTGVRNAYFDSLNSTEEIFAYVSFEDMEKSLKKINQDYISERFRLQVPKKIIAPYSEFNCEYVKTYDTTCTEVRLMKEGSLPFRLALNIYDGKVSYITYRDRRPIGVIIDDEDIYDVHRSSFFDHWNLLSPL